MTTEQKANTLHFLPQLKKIDAIQCAIKYQAEYGHHIDWHEFSSFLDQLREKGILRSISSGMTQYVFNK